MNSKNLNVKIINPLECKKSVLDLLQQLNPTKKRKDIEDILIEMNNYSNYICFGLFIDETLIGLSGSWTTTRIYSGKQLELDNLIIETKIQSKGYGKYFIDKIKEWALKNNYKSIELNSYVENTKSHKFYFNQDFKILGFHFEHLLNKNI